MLKKLEAGMKKTYSAWYKSSWMTTALVCMGGLLSIQSSKNSDIVTDNKPRINFAGELITILGEKLQVENCTIGGLYRQIPVYALPKDADIDPVIDTTFIDLDQVKQIRTPFDDGSKPQSYTFKKRPFNEIIVIMNNDAKSEHHYILEATRKFMCQVIDGDKRLDREMSFLALKSITITSFKKHEDQYTQKLENQKHSAAKAATCSKALDTIKELESGPQNKEMADKLNSLKNSVCLLCQDGVPQQPTCPIK